jgi:hypothetical protein
MNHFARWVTNFSLDASEAALLAAERSKRVPTSAREDTRLAEGSLLSGWKIPTFRYVIATLRS